MSHNEYVLAALRTGPKTNRELLRGAFIELGEGITTHCRIADVRRELRRQGEDIACERVPGTRSTYRYEIVSSIPEGQLTLA